MKLKRLERTRRVICLAGIFIFFLFIFTQPILAQLTELEQAAEEAGLIEKGKGSPELPVIVGRIIGIVLSLMGVILVVLLVASGFMWMTSVGNEEKIKKAKALMSSAVVGLIIVILAYAMSNFVVDRLADITKQ